MKRKLDNITDSKLYQLVFEAALVVKLAADDDDTTIYEHAVFSMAGALLVAALAVLKGDTSCLRAALQEAAIIDDTMSAGLCGRRTYFDGGESN